jgi:transposase
MYLRTVKSPGPGNTVYEYLRLVEAYREDGKVKQRVVANLGRKDLLAPHAEALLRLLTGKPAPAGYVPSQQVEPRRVWRWGAMLAARTLWQRIGVEEILDRLDTEREPGAVSLSDRALVLVANRLAAPGSEHGLARWLETDFVCDRHGRQWQPCWREDAERLASRSPRVRVESQQLAQWYRTLDRLHRHKARIETELYGRLRNLFSLKVDLAFYDLTSTYFEGHGPARLGAHGHSRDGKPRNRQVLVGVVLVDGFPLAHHVFRGNRRDAATVPEVMKDLQQRFGLRRVIVVGDRGMVTSDNLKILRELGHGYLVGLQRRRNATVYRYVESATGPWLDCPVGLSAGERSHPPRTRVCEVATGQAGLRVFVVDSEERRAYEQAEREKAMKRVREALEALQRRVERGQIKAPAKIGAAAGRLLTRYHGHRYYAWECDAGTFRFFEHPQNLAREKAYEGKYVIQTDEPRLSAVEAVQVYKNLSDVERGFRHLKDVLEMRPIYHHTDARVEAHLFVAALAFLLLRVLERKLQAAGVDLSAPEALEVLQTVCVVDTALGPDQTKRCVSRGSARADRILRALEIADPAPPKPPQGEELLPL